MIDMRNTVALASEWKLDSVPMWILIALAVLTLVMYAVKAAKRGRMRAESVKAESERVEAMREDAPPVKTEETETEIPAETFDPNVHNAVMHIEDDEHGESEIVEVLQKGFAKGDKVIRYAMVKVAN